MADRPDDRGEMARRIQAHDWAATPLGPREDWPQSLRTAVNIMLGSGHAMQLAWGPARTVLYNDAYAPMLGRRHPQALGLPFHEAWPDVWDAIAPLVDRVFAGETVRYQDLPLTMTRSGYPEETWWNFSYSPVRDEAGAVAGLLNVTVDATSRVRTERAEAALRESERRLRNVLEGMDESFGLMDRDLRIITQNEAALRIDGRRLEDLRGRTHAEAYPGAAPALEQLYRRALADGVPVSLEHRHAWPDGTATWLDMRAIPVPEGLAVFWRDITARKVAEEALRASEQKYRAMFESLDEGVSILEVLLDETGQAVDYRFIENNPAVERMTGVADATGKTVRELFPDIDPGLIETAGEVARSGRPVRFEHAVPALGRWFDVHEARVGGEGSRTVVAVFADVTARRRADQALRESEERFRLIVESARDYAIFVTDEHDVITDWMPGAEAVFGWTAEEAVGQPGSIVFTPEERAAGAPRQEFETARLDGSAPNVRWHLRKDGMRVFIEGRVMALHHPDGRFRGVLKIGQDVTERKRGEERQALLSREVDHRAKNVIALVQSMIRLTRAATVAEFVEVLGGRLQALSHVHSLLACDRWRGADLRALVESELRPFLAGGGGPHARVDGPPVRLPPDAVQPLAMAVHELTTNAVKYGALSAPAGAVSVAWHVADHDARHRLLRLCWVETGGPAVTAAPERLGFGSTVIEGAVRHQLDGVLSFAWEGTGLVCKIEVPLGREA